MLVNRAQHVPPPTRPPRRRRPRRIARRQGRFRQADGKRIRERGASNCRPGEARAQARRLRAARTGRSQRHAGLRQPVRSVADGARPERRGPCSPRLADFRPTIPSCRRSGARCRRARRRSARARSAAARRRPIRAMEEVREHNNLNKCNHRRKIGAEHAEAFPEVSSTVDATSLRPPPTGATTAARLLLNLRARARRTLEAIGALPRARRRLHAAPSFAACAPRCSASTRTFCACPPTGTPVEIRLVETKGGWRYWECAEPTSVENIAAGAPTTRQPVSV